MVSAEKLMLGILNTPERNNFFYGKLMDVDRCEKDHHYFNGKRWLINRLAVGCGVVRGLNVVKFPQNPELILIERGLAIDAWGREIVVASPAVIDPRQLTDEHGHPQGGRLGNGATVTISLRYKESKTDPVPVLAPDCSASTNSHDNCAFGTIREEFSVLVHPQESASPAGEPVARPFDEFPLPADKELQQRLCARLSAPLPEPPADPCALSRDAGVMLARVALDDTIVIDACSDRELVYGNRLLYELLLGLAERVEKLAGGRILRYHSGDGQSGMPERVLDKPLAVQLVDAEGVPAADETVEFRQSGAGGLALAHAEASAFTPSLTVTTDMRGIARARWQLGANAAEQVVVAGAVGSSFKVTFHAYLAER